MYKAIDMGAVGINLPSPEAVQMASKFEFEGYYLNIREDVKAGIPKMRELLSELNLIPAGFGLPVNFRGAEDTFKNDLKELKVYAKAAAELGADRCSTYIFSWHDEMDFIENFNLHRDRLREAAKILAEYNIKLGFEFLGPKTLRMGHKYEFIHTLKGMLELCDAVNTGNTGLLLDCFHWYMAGQTDEDFKLIQDEKMITLVHINDAPLGIPFDEQMDTVRCLPGETGVLDVKAFLNNLKKLGYSGPVVVEPFSQKLKSMDTEGILEAVKKSIDSVWDI